MSRTCWKNEFTNLCLSFRDSRSTARISIALIGLDLVGPDMLLFEFSSLEESLSISAMTGCMIFSTETFIEKSVVVPLESLILSPSSKLDLPSH